MKHIWALVCGLLLVAFVLVQAAAAGVNNPGYVPPPKPVEANKPYNEAHPSPTQSDRQHPGRDPQAPGENFRRRDEERFQSNVEDNERALKLAKQPQERAPVPDFGRYGLAAPGPDTAWVRVGNDAVLINQKTGAVEATRHNAFPATSPAATPPR